MSKSLSPEFLELIELANDPGQIMLRVLDRVELAANNYLASGSTVNGDSFSDHRKKLTFIKDYSEVEGDLTFILFACLLKYGRFNSIITSYLESINRYKFTKINNHSQKANVIMSTLKGVAVNMGESLESDIFDSVCQELNHRLVKMTDLLQG